MGAGAEVGWATNRTRPALASSPAERPILWLSIHDSLARRQASGRCACACHTPPTSQPTDHRPAPPLFPPSDSDADLHPLIKQAHTPDWNQAEAAALLGLVLRTFPDTPLRIFVLSIVLLYDFYSQLGSISCSCCL
jgi:hypothetical protein